MRDLLAQDVSLRPEEAELAAGILVGETRFMRTTVNGRERAIVVYNTGTVTFVASWNLHPTDYETLLKQADGSRGFAGWLMGFNERRNADKIHMVANLQMRPEQADAVINIQTLDELGTIAAITFGASAAAVNTISSLGRVGNAMKRTPGRRLPPRRTGEPPSRSNRIRPNGKELPEIAEDGLRRDIETLKTEHRNLSDVNARAVLTRPEGTAHITVRGATGKGRGDIVFRDSSRAKVLRREVKTISTDNTRALGNDVRGSVHGNQAMKGDEIFIQVPRGYDVKRALGRMAGAAKRDGEDGNLQFIYLQVRDETGVLLYQGPAFLKPVVHALGAGL